MTAMPPDPDRKWAILAKIDLECWEQRGTSSQVCPIWELKADWLRVMFKNAYVSVRACAPAGMRPLYAVCFVTPEGLHELRVFSHLRAGEYYDSSWRFGEAPPGTGDRVGHLGRRRLEVALTNGETSVASANAIWMVDPARLGQQLGPQDLRIRIFCPTIDETVDVNAATLDLAYQENQLEKQMKVVPWQRYLFWLTQLRRIDKAAYGRIPKTVRRWLEGADGQACLSRMSEQDVGRLLQQGMLPPYLAWLNPQEAQQVMDSIRVQRGVAGRQDVLQQYALMMQIPGFNPIPRLIQAIDPGRLDIFDLQVFMTIGALRELHGFVEVQQAELIKRRPDLQAAMQSPQGARQLQADSEVMALAADPRAQAWQAEQLELQARRAGNYGPTSPEVMTAMQVITNIQQQQLGMMMLGSNLGMFAGLNAAEQYTKLALANGPPWKLYKPYCC